MAENLLSLRPEIGKKLAASLNGDAAFRHWGRSLCAAAAFVCGDVTLTLTVENGAVRLTPGAEAQVVLSGDEAQWARALDTGWSQGFYDVTEAPDRLHLAADPYLIAANAKAFTRLWKQLRSALRGEERAWDWNV